MTYPVELLGGHTLIGQWQLSECWEIETLLLLLLLLLFIDQMDENDLESLWRDLDKAETGLWRPNWRRVIIIIIIILSKMPVNTTGYYNHAFSCDIFYHFFLFIIEIPALISSVGVLQSVVVCARCSALSSSSTCIPQNTVWQQLFSVLQTLLQIFRDVTKTSFTFKVSCSFTQHA